MCLQLLLSVQFYNCTTLFEGSLLFEWIGLLGDLPVRPFTHHPPTQSIRAVDSAFVEFRLHRMLVVSRWPFYSGLSCFCHLVTTGLSVPFLAVCTLS